MNKLFIALDPGFNGGKIVVNQQLFILPSAIKDITEELHKYPIIPRDKNHVRLKFNDRIYLVGDYASKSLLNEDNNNADDEKNDLYNIAKFGTELFHAGLIAMLGYGLYKYEEYSIEKDIENPFKISEIDKWELCVGVALPHEFQDDIWNKHVKKYLHDKHNFTLHIGADLEINYNFELKEENCVYNSQAVCALISVITDDFGNATDNTKSILDYLPVLVLDGGYKTFGMFKLSKDRSIGNAESNTKYAMHNIHEDVAAIIRKDNENIKSYMIEEYYNTNELIYYQDENGEFKSHNVREIRDEITEKTAKKLIDYLVIKYNKLLDIKMIVVSGGTGAAYYDYIKDFADKRPNLKGKTILTDVGFNGEKCDPVYAIAIGLYKAMISSMQ